MPVNYEVCYWTCDVKSRWTGQGSVEGMMHPFGPFFELGDADRVLVQYAEPFEREQERSRASLVSSYVGGKGVQHKSPGGVTCMVRGRAARKKGWKE